MLQFGEQYEAQAGQYTYDIGYPGPDTYSICYHTHFGYADNTCVGLGMSAEYQTSQYLYRAAMWEFDSNCGWGQEKFLVDFYPSADDSSWHYCLYGYLKNGNWEGNDFYNPTNYGFWEPYFGMWTFRYVLSRSDIYPTTTISCYTTQAFQRLPMSPPWYPYIEYLGVSPYPDAYIVTASGTHSSGSGQYPP